LPPWTRAASFSSAEKLQKPEALAAQGFPGIGKNRVFVQTPQIGLVDYGYILQEKQLTFGENAVKLISSS
jgi:hypothetical protein